MKIITAFHFMACSFVVACTHQALGQPSHFAASVQSWSKSLAEFSRGSWQWQHTESGSSSLGSTTETVSIFNADALANELRIIPNNSNTLGVHQIGGFTEKGDWLVVDRNTSTYEKASIDLDTRSRLQMFELFVGLAPAGAAYFVKSGDILVLTEDIAVDPSGLFFSWSPEEMPNITFEFLISDNRPLVLKSITRTSGTNGKGVSTRFEYSYEDKDSPIPSSVVRQVTLDESALEHKANLTGKKPESTTVQTLRLVSFTPLQSPDGIYIDTSDILKFDSENGHVLDGDGEIVATYTSDAERMTARQWSTVGLLAGLSGICVAIGVIIYRRIRA